MRDADWSASGTAPGETAGSARVPLTKATVSGGSTSLSAPPGSGLGSSVPGADLPSSQTVAALSFSPSSFTAVSYWPPAQSLLTSMSTNSLPLTAARASTAAVEVPASTQYQSLP